MRSKTRKRRYRAPDNYLQYLYDKALIPLESYRKHCDAVAVDFAVFWSKGGYIWLN